MMNAEKIMFFQCYPFVKWLSSYGTCSLWPRKMFRCSRTAWRVTKKRLRTGTRVGTL